LTFRSGKVSEADYGLMQP